MPWPKPSLEKTRLLERALSARGERRMLFGAPCWFIRGNMFAGVFAEDIFLRFGVTDLVEAKRLGAKLFEPVKGRVMKEYATFPEALMGEKPLSVWLEKSYLYASSLPVKTGKK
jgi:TfoX/Sxy family transcriptional regulator of competence genes